MRTDLNSHDFQLVETLVGKKLDVGVNRGRQSISSDWHTFDQLHDADLAHKHTWLNAKSDNDLRRLVKHFLVEYAKSPADTSACILVPHPKSLPNDLRKDWRVILNVPKGHGICIIPEGSDGTTRDLGSARNLIQVLYYAPSPKYSL